MEVKIRAKHIWKQSSLIEKFMSIMYATGSESFDDARLDFFFAQRNTSHYSMPPNSLPTGCDTHRKTIGHKSIIFWLIVANRVSSDKVKWPEFGNASIFVIFQEINELRPWTQSLSLPEPRHCRYKKAEERRGLDFDWGTRSEFRCDMCYKVGNFPEV